MDVENVEDMLARLKAPSTLGGMALAGTVASLNHMVTTQLSTWGGQVRRPEKFFVTVIARALALKVVYVCLVFHTNVCTCGFGYLFSFCGSAQKAANDLNCTCTRVCVGVCVPFHKSVCVVPCMYSPGVRMCLRAFACLNVYVFIWVRVLLLVCGSVYFAVSSLQRQLL